MHPTIESLLTVRDGVADADVRRHVDACAECSAEVARLARTREALRALPPVAPPPGAFAKLAAARAAGRRRTRHAALAVAASVVMVVALLVMRQPSAPPMIAAEVGVAALAARSDQLDSMLAAVETQSRFTDLRTAGAIVALEDQLATVDARLRQLDVADERTAAQLLRRRIALVNTLVDVHAAQIQHSF